MFRENDIEAYSKIKAPIQLKSRILLSVESQRKKMTRQTTAWVSAVACLAIMFFAGRFMYGNDTVVSVNQVAVSYQAIDLNDVSGLSMAVMSRGRSSVQQIQIPLEINVTKDTYVKVSQGTLQKANITDSSTNNSSNNISETLLSESSVVYWIVNGMISDPPACTITVGEKEYVYLVEFDEEEAVFTIRQSKTK